MPENTSKDDLTFEKAMERLEQTVKSLESGDLALTESIERYKEAMSLVQFCRNQLNHAELEIEQLMEQSSDAEASDEEASQ